MAETQSNSSGLLKLPNLGIDPETTVTLLDLFKKTLETTLKKILMENSVANASQSPGTELRPQDKIKATDLRVALLMGKLPDDSGLLIDTKTFAQLLSISPRHLSRMQELKSVPEPVNLGRSIRWRLTEVIEWIDDGCPSRRIWETRKRVLPKSRRK